MSDQWKRIVVDHMALIVRCTCCAGDDGDAENGPRPYCYVEVRELRFADTGRPVPHAYLWDKIPGFGCVSTDFYDKVYAAVNDEPWESKADSHSSRAYSL